MGDGGDGLVWYGRRVEPAPADLPQQTQEAFDELLRLVGRLSRADPAYGREVVGLFARRLLADVRD